MVSASFKIQGGVLTRPFIIEGIKEDEIYRPWQTDHATLPALFQGPIGPDGILIELQ